jgi:hypothetical protein
VIEVKDSNVGKLTDLTAVAACPSGPQGGRPVRPSQSPVGAGIQPTNDDLLCRFEIGLCREKTNPWQVNRAIVLVKISQYRSQCTSSSFRRGGNSSFDVRTIVESLSINRKELPHSNLTASAGGWEHRKNRISKLLTSVLHLGVGGPAVEDPRLLKQPERLQRCLIHLTREATDVRTCSQLVESACSVVWPQELEIHRSHCKSFLSE